MQKSENETPDYGVWPIADDTKFPPGFFNIGDQTFLEVYNTKKVFVDFIQRVEDTKGLFAAFQKYCFARN